MDFTTARSILLITTRTNSYAPRSRERGATASGPAASSATGSRFTVIAIAASVGLVAAGLSSLSQERTVSAAIARLDRQAVSLRTGRPSAEPSPKLSISKPPRAVLADALYVAQQTDRADSDNKRQSLLTADAVVADLTAKRPHSGEAWLVKALLRAKLAGEGNSSAIDALVRSYREAPFLYDAAEWRVGFGARQWRLLDTATRFRLVNEALVYGQINGSTRLQIFAGIRDTEAYTEVLSAWHAMQRQQLARSARASR